MYIENQPTTNLDRGQLVAAVTDLKKSGYRLVVITCTLSDTTYEITYSFDKDNNYSALRVSFPRADATVPSITGVYLAAFPYENELQDLFGLTVPEMKLNFKGSFYKVAIKNPFVVPVKTSTPAA